MNWFVNLKIASKIAVFATVTILFILIVGLVGFNCNQNASASMKNMYESKLVALQSMFAVRNNLNAIKSDLFDSMLTTDLSVTKKLHEDISVRREENNQMLKEFENSQPDSFEKEQLAHLQEIFPAYRAAVNESIELTAQNRNTEAYKVFVTKGAPLAEDVNTIVKAIVKHDKETAKKLYDKNKNDAAAANMTIITCILLALVVAITFSVWMINMLDRRFKVLVNLANQLADGDMTAHSEVTSQDEIGVTGTAINTAASKLRGLIREVLKNVQEISSSSEEMFASADQTAQGAQQTAISTQQLAQGSQEISNNVQRGATTVGNVNTSIQGISKEAIGVAKLGNDTEVSANEGSEYVKKAVVKIDSIKAVSHDISVTIEQLGTLSSEIEQIVDLIKSIAGQTNLLALNAAIEAARAGEHGKGFAVVADEVKKLAGESAEATDKITSMIKEIQSKTNDAVGKMTKATNEVEEGVFVVNDAGRALEGIISQVKQANLKIQGITQEIEGVATNSEDVVRMIENISSITEETAASAEEISSIAEEQTASTEEISASAQVLAKIAENLSKQVSVFKV